MGKVSSNDAQSQMSPDKSDDTEPKCDDNLEKTMLMHL